jgi:hypothetical protein
LCQPLSFPNTYPMERHASLPAIVGADTSNPRQGSSQADAARLRQAVLARDTEARQTVKVQKENHVLQAKLTVSGAFRSTTSPVFLLY